MLLKNRNKVDYVLCCLWGNLSEWVLDWVVELMREKFIPQILLMRLIPFFSSFPWNFIKLVDLSPSRQAIFSFFMSFRLP